MKKIRLLFLEFMLVMFPVSVHALSGGVSITCSPSTASPGAEVQCAVSGTSDAAVTSFEAALAINGSAAAVSFTKTNDKWEKCDLKDSKVAFGCYGDATDISGSFGFGTLTIKIADDAQPGDISVSVSNVKFGDSSFHPVTDGLTGGSATITVSSSGGSGGNENPTTTSSGLSSLVCSDGCVLSPQFSASNTSYTVILSSASTTSFSLSATTANSGDEISFVDTDSDEILNPSGIIFKTSGGKSTMLIAVKVGTGDNLKTYNLAVSKPETKMAELSSLTVGGKSITLVGGKYDYSITLPSIDSFQISAVVADSDNFAISDTSGILNTSLTEAGVYGFDVVPKDNTSGYATQSYIITVNITGSSTSGGSGGSGGTGDVTVNPKTGSTSAVIIGLMLIISLFATLRLYRNNLDGYKKGSK